MHLSFESILFKHPVYQQQSTLGLSFPISVLVNKKKDSTFATGYSEFLI